MTVCLVFLFLILHTATIVALQSYKLQRNSQIIKQRRSSPLFESWNNAQDFSKSSSSTEQHNRPARNKQHRSTEQGKKQRWKQKYRSRTPQESFCDDLRHQLKQRVQYAEELLLNTLQHNKTLVTAKSFHIVLMGYAREADATSAVRAETLLQQMTAQDHINPTVFAYNTVMQAWSNHRANQKTNKMSSSVSLRPYYAIFRLFEDMQKRHQIKPTTFSYNLLMESNLRLASQWYSTMVGQNVSPDRKTYHTLFRAYSQNATKGAAEEADALLEELMQFKQEAPSDCGSKDSPCDHFNFQPNTFWINCVISAWSKTTLLERGKKADAWFQRMQLKRGCHPNTSTYSQLMNVHASLYLEQRKPSHKKRVLDLLRDLEYRHSTCKDSEKNYLQPDVITYTTAMKVMTVTQALELFQKMKDGPRKMQPNIITYNTLIKILCGSSQEQHTLPEQKHPMFVAMDLYYELLKDPQKHPDAVTHTELIFGWAQTRRADAGYRAEEMLQELEINTPPSSLESIDLTKVYNAVIIAWGRTSNSKAPDRVEKLLDKMERTEGCMPNIITYISLADAYAKAAIPDAEVKCEALLARMKKQDPNNNIKPNRVLYNSILNALAKSCKPSAIDKAEEILNVMGDDVDIFTYSTMVDCYTKCCKDPTIAINKAEEVLEIVEDAYDNTQDERFKPSPVFYSAILQAYAKSKVGDIEAEALLRRNERLFNSNSTRYSYCKPHAILYNAVMDAIARSGNPDAGRRAEALLQEMEEQLDDGEVTRRSLNAILLAYRHDADACDKAEYILQRMEELTLAGVYDVMPDLIAWNTAIAALAGHNADRAHALFQRMQERHDVNPDGMTYSYVIQAWLKRNDERGMQMAQSLLNDYYNNHHYTNDNHHPDKDLTLDPVFHVVHAYQQQQQQRVEIRNDDDKVIKW